MSDSWHLTKIPKRAYFYWGGGTLPYLRYLTIASFRYYNPDWETILYYSITQQKDITWKTKEQEYPLVCDDYCQQAIDDETTIMVLDNSALNIPNDIAEVHKSDFLRWYLLSTLGGVWIDMDILFFKPMTDLYFNLKINEHIETVFCSGSYGHSVGFLMGSVGNRYYNSLWQESHKRFKKETYQSIGVTLCNDMFPNPVHYSVPNSVNMSMSVVYYYDANNVRKLYAPIYTDNLPTNAIGIHWYGAHQASGKFLNETNGGLVKSNCLLGKYIQEFKDKTNGNK